ncbi:MAG: ABC transporter substrate-binding protein [Anaerolineae bacterium]|nr:ABC transporter substrate-binding protein [Anaerolineae bacterium]
MSVKLKTLVTFFALLSLALLTACGAAPATEQPAAPTEAPQPATEAPQEAASTTAPEPAATEAEAEAAAPEGDPIVIGAVFNATGWMAAYDQPPRQGALLAVEEINKAGGVLGRPLQLIELDGKTDPATVGNVTRQLIDQGADVIIAPCDFDIGAPASQAAQEADLVGLSTCASSPLYGSQALGDKQFTLSMWNNIMSAGAAEHAYTKAGFQTAYIVADTSIDYSLSLGDYFEKHFTKLGGKVIGKDTYVQGDADFSAQIQRIKGLSEQPDVLFISSYSPDLGTIIKQTRAAGITTPIMGGDTYDDAQFWQVVGPDLGTDLIFATHGWLGPESGKANLENFVALYEAKYNEKPGTAFILTGWDAVNVLAQAIEKAGSTDGAAVAKAMEETEFDLLSGKLDWTPAAEGHQPIKEVAIVQLQGGQPSFVGWILPEAPPEP